MITPSEIRGRLKEIREATFNGAFDDEKAHGLEDRLYVDVLKAIAAGPISRYSSSYLQQLARLALNTRRIKFERWTA